MPYSSSEESSENERTTGSFQGSENSTDAVNNSSIAAQKRKRQQWSVTEKVHAIAYFEKTDNKHQTEKYIGRATKQIRTWLKNKPTLMALSTEKKGKVSFFEKSR